MIAKNFPNCIMITINITRAMKTLPVLVLYQNILFTKMYTNLDKVQMFAAQYQLFLSSYNITLIIEDFLLVLVPYKDTRGPLISYISKSGI